MAMNMKVAAVATVVLGVAVAGGYQAGKQQGAVQTATKEAAHAVPGKAGPLPTGAAVPAGHPPMPGAQAAEAQTSGKLDNVDRSKKFTHFRVGNKNVKRIFADGKIMWIGTSGGVIRYDTSSDDYKLFDVRSGLLSNGIFHVGKLQGRIVLGTYGGGMSLLDEGSGKWETFNIPEGLGDAFVYDVLTARNGDVWVATWSGVNRVRGGQLRDRTKWDLFTVENTKNGLPNDWVYGLAEGKDGEVWLATEGGLASFKNGKWRNWNHTAGLGAPYDLVKNDIQFKTDPSRVSSHHAKQKQEMGLSNVDVAYNPNYIVAIVVDAKGTVWAGTWGGGLARFDGGKFRNYTVADGLPGNHVFMLHTDEKGRLWVGTNNGLARMDGDKFSVMNMDDGLFASAVFSMASTGPNIWVGSYGGVAQIRGVN